MSQKSGSRWPFIGSCIASSTFGWTLEGPGRRAAGRPGSSAGMLVDLSFGHGVPLPHAAALRGQETVIERPFKRDAEYGTGPCPGGSRAPDLRICALAGVLQARGHAADRGLHQAFRGRARGARRGTAAAGTRARRRTGCGTRSRAAARAWQSRSRSCPVTASTSSVGARELVADRAGEVGAVPARQVQLGDRRVGLRERQLRVLEQRGEERPVADHPRSRASPPRRGGDRREARSRARTSRSGSRGSGPTRTPTGSRAGRRARGRRRPTRATGRDAMGSVADLRDRGDPPEELDEARSAHERGRSAAWDARAIASISSPKRSAGITRRRPRAVGADHRVRELLEVALARARRCRTGRTPPRPARSP